jgi:hypothetical protein
MWEARLLYRSARQDSGVMNKSTLYRMPSMVKVAGCVVVVVISYSPLQCLDSTRLSPGKSMLKFHEKAALAG